MTWDDDQKAASFVSAKDPEVLKFAKAVVGPIRAAGYDAIDMNLRVAMGLFEALNEYGLSYVIDPNTPSYVEATKDFLVIDFLQFPSETLFYKGGDCDDLSILYSALLEAVGVETAFVTVPGHIFLAVSLDMDPDEARKTFSDEESLIFAEGGVWIPVEITKLHDGFLEAWRVGAEEWRNSATAGTAALLPLRQCWQVYEAAGAEGKKDSVGLPDMIGVETAYSRQMESFIQRELYPQVEKLTQLAETSRKPQKVRNKLGVLYARYGLLDKAREVFEGILGNQVEYGPALVNMGNIHYNDGDYEKAAHYFERAHKQLPGSAAVNLALARVNYDLGNLALVKEYYAVVREKKESLAERFSYLALKGTQKKRATDVERLRAELVWEEE
ncbi:hypothetical protein ES703_111890 [subsurface metagenome]